MALPDRKARPPDRKALAKAIEDLLLASGAELDAETRETPARVAKAFSEDLLDGYARDAIETLKSSLVPAPRRGELVIASQIDFHAMCPHHLLPYKGSAAVGDVAEHGCMQVRGPMRRQSRVTVEAWAGGFEKDSELRHS